jgi:predicted transcriptional regulator
MEEPATMEVHVKPEVQAKLDQMARETGCPSDELVEDALIGYFDQLEYAREMLDRRYDDLESGKVKLISGDEVKERLRAKSASRRAGLS